MVRAGLITRAALLGPFWPLLLDSWPQPRGLLGGCPPGLEILDAIKPGSLRLINQPRLAASPACLGFPSHPTPTRALPSSL